MTSNKLWDILSTVGDVGSTIADFSSAVSTEMTTPRYTADCAINWTSSATSTEVPPSEYAVTTVFILGILLNVLGVIGNILVLVVIACTKELRKTYNICVASLALNDMCLCLFSNITMAVGIRLRSFPLAPPFCLLHNMLWSHLAFVSILNISLISLLRYILVVHQKISNRLHDNKLIILCIVVVFHVTAFFMISFDKIGKDTWFDPNMGLCWIVGDTSSRVYMFVAVIILGVLATLFSYLGIYFCVKSQRRRVHAASNSSQYQTMGRNLQRTLRHQKMVGCMLIVIATTLLGTMFPTVSLSFVLKMQKISPIIHFLIPVAVWIFTVANFAVYSLSDKAFRKGYKKLFRRKTRIVDVVQ